MSSDKKKETQRADFASILRCATESTEESSEASRNNSISPLGDRSATSRSIASINTNASADADANGDSDADADADADQDADKKRTNRRLRSSSRSRSRRSAGSGDKDASIDCMIAPSTKEARENERYARKVGINFSITRGDYLTLYSGLKDDESLLTEISAALSSSPQYGKKDDHFTFRNMYGNVNQILDNAVKENGSVNSGYEYEYRCNNSNPIPTSSVSPQDDLIMYGDGDGSYNGEGESTELVLNDQVHGQADVLITPRTRTKMHDHDQVVEALRERAAILSKDWVTDDNLAPSLARKLRDFEFAQKKRRRAHGESKQWGILALYDFLTAVRQDVQWAEDAGFRRSNCLPYLRWSDFVKSKESRASSPYFSYCILLICTLFLVISFGLNGWAFEPFSTNPSFGPSPEVLMKMGAKHSNSIVNSNEIWRLLTPMILHSGILHFLLNCFAIFYIGRAVEQNHGTASTTILFVIPSIGSTIASAIFLPQYISVGASGGIFGLLGACVADIVKNRKLLFSGFINKGRSKKHHVYVVLVLVLDIFINMLMGLTPFTDNFMHVGGFVLGFICASTMLSEVDIDGTRSNHVRSRATNIFVRYFGLMICCLSIIVGSVMLFHGDGVTSPCESCDVLSCVSFPPWADQDKRWYYCDDCGSVVAYGRKDPKTGEYAAIEMNCPRGNTIIFSLDGADNDKESLRENLPTFCRQKCL